MCPVMPDFFQRRAGRFCSAKAFYQVRGACQSLAYTQDKDNLPFLFIQQLKRNPDSGARIETGAHLAGEARLMHPSGIRECPVPAEKLGAISGDSSVALIGVKERDAIGK